MARRNVPGTTYLLHLDPPYKHARHYLGFAEGDHLDARLADHGTERGARLLAVAKQAGSTWRLVRTWPGTTRATERQIKNTRHVPHYCPECQPQRSAARRQLQADRSAPPQRKDTEMDNHAPRDIGEDLRGRQRKGPVLVFNPPANVRWPALDQTAAEARDREAAREDEAISDYMGGNHLDQNALAAELAPPANKTAAYKTAADRDFDCCLAAQRDREAG